MRTLNLVPGDPLSLILAADARLCESGYANDQIWEISLAGGDPPGLALQTTYGLRARSMRLLPRFVEGITALTDPGGFAAPPVVKSLAPNFCEVHCSPFEGLEARFEYWIPGSQACAGRVRLTNRGEADRQVRFEWVAILLPGEDGERLVPQDMQGVPFLGGRCGELYPVVFITGGAEAAASPFPALSFSLELQPGKTRQFTWCHAGLASNQESFDMAQATASRNWEAERARIEMLNAGQVEIYTGDADWDKAFALGQTAALRMVVCSSEHLPNRSFVGTRHPDRGFSPRGDGTDFGPFWAGQTSLEANYLASLLLPTQPELAKGWLLNFLHAQTDEGEIDWRPGLAGQRSGRLATPLLGDLAWRIYQFTEDRAFLSQVFEPLLDFLRSWFKPEHDRDGDGIPEWDTTIQAGFEDHLLFSRWHAWAQGIDITTAESPALCAMLYRECQVLLKMAGLLERRDAVPEVEALAAKLQVAVEAGWSDAMDGYPYWDRDSHTSQPAVLLGERLGSGSIQVHQDFALPARVVFWVRCLHEATRRSQAFIHGVSPSGSHRVERVSMDRFLWFPGWGTATSDRTYARIDYIELQGIHEEDLTTAHSAGFAFQDVSSLLPLWANIPPAERAARLISGTLTNPDKFWGAYGLPACPEGGLGEGADSCLSVYLPWCSLVGEGLLAYGYREEAAELVTRITKAVVQTLKTEQTFRQVYKADTGKGSGEREALAGLPPLGLFLDVLGVKLLSPHKVCLEGTNPFPGPVTVKFRGLTVLRGKEKTTITFPDGQSVTVEDPSPQVVSLE